MLTKGQKTAVGFGVGAIILGAALLIKKPRVAPPPPPPGLANLYGKVTDTITGQPIAGVWVSFSTGPAGVLSDTDGNYVISSIEPGEYVVVLSAAGYTATGGAITIVEGNNELNVQMSPSTPPPEGVQIPLGDIAILSVGGKSIIQEGSDYLLSSPIQFTQSSLSFGIDSIGIEIIGDIPRNLSNNPYWDYHLFTFLSYPTDTDFALGQYRGIVSTKPLALGVKTTVTASGDFVYPNLNPPKGIYPINIAMQIWIYQEGDYRDVTRNYGSVQIDNAVEIL